MIYKIDENTEKKSCKIEKCVNKKDDNKDGSNRKNAAVFGFVVPF